MTPAPHLQDRLRACPFCRTAHRLEVRSANINEASVFCGNCATLGPTAWGCEDNSAEAARLWNTRPELDRLEKLVEEARGATLADKLSSAITQLSDLDKELGSKNWPAANAAHDAVLAFRSLLSHMNKETGE